MKDTLSQNKQFWTYTYIRKIFCHFTCFTYFVLAAKLKVEYLQILTEHIPLTSSTHLHQH